MHTATALAELPPRAPSNGRGLALAPRPPAARTFTIEATPDGWVRVQLAVRGQVLKAARALTMFGVSLSVPEMSARLIGELEQQARDGGLLD
jgi:hypothetical protein